MALKIEMNHLDIRLNEEVRGLLLPKPHKPTTHYHSPPPKTHINSPTLTTTSHQNHNFSFTISNCQSPKITTTDSCKSPTTNHKLIFFIPVMLLHYLQCCTKYNDFTAEKQTTDYSNLFSHMISIQTAIAWQIVQQYISPRQASTIKLC